MKRILLRSGKSPFRVVSHEEFIHQNLMGTNSGNLLFSDAVHKLLLTKRTEVVSNGIKTDCSARRAQQINEEYDVFVVPLANAFRPEFQTSLDRLSTLVEQLTIPVVVLGIGAQTATDYDTEVLRPMEPSVRRFAAAILDRSASIGVRGELTASYLDSLGFRDVEIIGCPSMFLYGDSFPVPRHPVRLTAESRIAISLSPNAIPVGDVAGIARHAHERFPNLMYYAQNLVDAELLYWGDTSQASGYHEPFPRQLSHPLLRENKVRVPIDPATWINELRSYDFAYGTRIHGNIAALLAGTPSVVLAYDSRTLELSRYFEIPHRLMSGTPADIHPQELHDDADYSGMLAGHRERFGRFVAFLDKNSLENTFSHGGGGASFDARVAELDLPPSIEVWNGSDDGGLRYRFSALREQSLQIRTKNDVLERKNKELERRLNAVQKQLAATERRVAGTERRVAGTERRVAGTERRVAGIERRVMVRLGPAIRRRIALIRVAWRRLQPAAACAMYWASVSRPARNVAEAGGRSVLTGS